MRTRSILTALAFLATGTVIGVTTQQIASADVSSGDRPVLVQITPCRITDTRPGESTVGPRSTPLGAGDTHTIDVQLAGTDCAGRIPSEASGVALNVTALGATELTFLTIWPGGTRPLASSLNPAPGEPPTPNAVTVSLSVDDEFEIYNDLGSVNIVIDITGYYVNHDHDDRYSKIGHDHDDRYSNIGHDHDDRYPRTSGFGQTHESAVLSDGAVRAGWVVLLPSAGTPTMTVAFGIPLERKTSDPILVSFPVEGPENCTFVLKAVGPAGPFVGEGGRFLNVGWSVLDSPDGTVDLGPAPTGSSEASTIVTLSFDAADQIAGGASFTVDVSRQADDPNDTCADPIVIWNGYSVQY